MLEIAQRFERAGFAVRSAFLYCTFDRLLAAERSVATDTPAESVGVAHDNESYAFAV